MRHYNTDFTYHDIHHIMLGEPPKPGVPKMNWPIMLERFMHRYIHSSIPKNDCLLTKFIIAYSNNEKGNNNINVFLFTNKNNFDFENYVPDANERRKIIDNIYDFIKSSFEDYKDKYNIVGIYFIDLGVDNYINDFDGSPLFCELYIDEPNPKVKLGYQSQSYHSLSEALFYSDEEFKEYCDNTSIKPGEVALAYSSGMIYMYFMTMIDMIKIENDIRKSMNTIFRKMDGHQEDTK